LPAIALPRRYGPSEQFILAGEPALLRNKASKQFIFAGRGFNRDSMTGAKRLPLATRFSRVFSSCLLQRSQP
jgi:hypothetical protein